MESPTGVPPVVARERLRALAACLGAFAVLAAFFLPALARYGSAHFSPADISQTQSLTRVETGHVPGNELLSDLAVQMEPWLMFNERELSAGRLPLWNPYNGGGTPHLANGQSAVFSPYSLPFYVLPFRAALLVAAAFKLCALGGFTYLFLRLLGLFRPAALLGGVVFAFSGHNVLLLGYPHPAAAATLPAGLYFVERAFQRFDAVGTPAPGALAGLCAALAVGMLAGQPEPCFFALGSILLYSIARAVVSWRRKGGTRAALVAIAPRLLRIAGAAAIALGLSAFQTLPFLEYLRESRLLEQRTGIQTPLVSETWPLHFFPDLLGNPSLDYYLHPNVPPPNFETANLAYAGALALLLAGASLFFARRHWAHACFAALALGWPFYAHDLLGVGRLLQYVPGLHIAPVNRSQAVWLFAVAVCAAFFVQRALEAERRRLPVALAVLALAGAALLALRAGAWTLFREGLAFTEHFLGRRPLDAAACASAAASHMDWMSALFGLGALAAAALWLAPRGSARVALAAVVVALAYLAGGNHFRNYNPLCDDRFFFPVTAHIERLQRELGSDRLVILGEDTLAPDTNMVYGISLVSSYDGLWVRRYDRLFRATFGETNNWRNALHGSARGLRVFGADWVLSRDEWIPIATMFPGVPMPRDQLFEVGEVIPNQQVCQGFTATQPRLQALRVFVTTHGEVLDSDVYWKLEDAATGAAVLNGTLDGARLTSQSGELKAAIIRFDAPLNVSGRPLRLRFYAPGARAGNAVTFWARRDARPIVNEALWRAERLRDLQPDAPIDGAAEHPDLGAWMGTFRGNAFDGALCLDLSYALGDFEVRASLPPFELFRFGRGVGRWHVVSRAVPATSEEDAFARTLHPALDVASAVVLEAADEGEVRASESAPEERTEIAVTRDLPCSKRLEFSRGHPGWLVLTQPWFPGWTARVNGALRPILRANYAFGAVRVDAGASVVELEYEPQSLRIGAWISLASLLAAAVYGARLRRQLLAADRR